MTALQPSEAATRKSVSTGLLTGLIHAVLAAVLWSTFGFEDLVATFSAEPLYVTYVVVGMFVVGFVPGLLYAQNRTFLPIVATGGLLGVTAFATWQAVQAGETPVDPTPFGWYMLLWIGVLVLDVVLGRVEFWMRRSPNN